MSAATKTASEKSPASKPQPLFSISKDKARFRWAVWSSKADLYQCPNVVGMPDPIKHGVAASYEEATTEALRVAPEATEIAAKNVSGYLGLLSSRSKDRRRAMQLAARIEACAGALEAVATGSAISPLSYDQVVAGLGWRIDQSEVTLAIVRYAVGIVRGTIAGEMIDIDRLKYAFSEKNQSMCRTLEGASR